MSIDLTEWQDKLSAYVLDLSTDLLNEVKDNSKTYDDAFKYLYKQQASSVQVKDKFMLCQEHVKADLCQLVIDKLHKEQGSLPIKRGEE